MGIRMYRKFPPNLVFLWQFFLIWLWGSKALVGWTVSGNRDDLLLLKDAAQAHTCRIKAISMMMLVITIDQLIITIPGCEFPANVKWDQSSQRLLNHWICPLCVHMANCPIASTDPWYSFVQPPIFPIHGYFAPSIEQQKTSTPFFASKSSQFSAHL